MVAGESPEWEGLFPYLSEMMHEYLSVNTGHRIDMFKHAPKTETHNAIRQHFIKNKIGMIKDRRGNLNPDREGMVVFSNKFVEEAVRIIEEDYFTVSRWTTSKGKNRVNVYQKGHLGVLHSVSEEEFEEMDLFKARGVA